MINKICQFNPVSDELNSIVSIEAKVTIRTNFFAVKETCDLLFPILKDGARVVNVSRFIFRFI